MIRVGPVVVLQLGVQVGAHLSNKLYLVSDAAHRVFDRLHLLRGKLPTARVARVMARGGIRRESVRAIVRHRGRTRRIYDPFRELI